MPTPFPGMDPYLERTDLWKQVHTGLIVGIQGFLNARLRPRYRAAIEERTYLALLPPDDQLVGIPDGLVISTDLSKDMPTSSGGGAAVVAEPEIGQLPMPEEVKDRYLEVRNIETQEVVTVIEILSPTNKLYKDGRSKYEDKRMSILASMTNLVEIDLLRAGEPHSMQVPRKTDYRIIVSRSRRRPFAHFYLFDLREEIPNFHIPLRPNEDEPVLELNQILHTLYETGGYDMAIDYNNPPVPPLSAGDEAWFRNSLSIR